MSKSGINPDALDHSAAGLDTGFHPSKTHGRQQGSIANCGREVATMADFIAGPEGIECQRAAYSAAIRAIEDEMQSRAVIAATADFLEALRAIGVVKDGQEVSISVDIA